MAWDSSHTGDKYPGGVSSDHLNSLARVARRYAPGVASPGNRPPGRRGYSLAIVRREADVEEKFQCKACGLLLREPVQNSCGHRFCRDCIIEVNEEDGPMECVACENEGEESKIEPEQCLPDRAIKRDMAALPACCPNEDCSWKGHFSDYIVHESSCEHRSETCDCGALVEASSLRRHLSKECSLRAVTCAFCNLTLQADNIPLHHEECRLYPMSCSECHQKVPRVNMEVHVDPIRGDCPKRKCPFGCDANIDPEHQQACALQHINITFQRVMAIEEQMKQIQATKNEKVSMLSVTAKPFYPSIAATEQYMVEQKFGGIDGILEWPIRAFRRKRIDAKKGNTRFIYSPPFLKGRNGYRMCACVYPDGDGMTRGRYMSLFLVIVRGQHDAELPWPFPHKVTMVLKDQTSSGRDLVDSFKPDATSSSFRRPITDRNTPSGNSAFVRLETLDDPDSRYVKDDTIILKVFIG